MKKWVSILVLSCVFIQILFNRPISAVARDSLSQNDLHARCAVLMDAETGRVLYGKEEELALPMASTTKIMTCIVALERAASDGLNEIVTISSYAASMPDVQLNMVEGEHYLLKDLLYSLMLESHNDSAVAIAEHIGGSVERFTEMMNQKAEELGCVNTCFLTPNGLDATVTKYMEDGNEVTLAHSSSAADMARILSYCILKSPQKEQFLSITQCGSHSFTNFNLLEDGGQAPGVRTFTCSNHNAFLYMMDGALTGKTGFTGNAGYCYVGALENEGRTYVIALLACGWPNHRTWKWEDAKKLFQYGIKNYQKKNIVDIQALNLPRIPVKNAQNKQGILSKQGHLTPIVPEQEHFMLLSSEEKVETAMDLPQELQAPVEAGQEIGKVNYYVNQKKVFELPVYAKESMPDRNQKWYWEIVWNRFFKKSY